MFHVTAQPAQSGARRLLALDQREEQARQLGVPLDAETRSSRALTLLLDEELSPVLRLSELTADPRCSEEALRQPEEAGDRADTSPLPRPPPPGKSRSPCRISWRRRPSVDFVPPARHLLVPPGPRPRAERTEAPPRPALHHLRCPLPRLRRRPRAPPRRNGTTLLVTCCELAADDKRQSAGAGAHGAPLRARRPGRRTRRSLNAAATPVSVSSAASRWPTCRRCPSSHAHSVGRSPLASP